MLHAKTFDPTKKFVISKTYEGEPRYAPKEVKGLPVFTKRGEMLLEPVVKIEPDAMIEWLKIEYPDSCTEFIRHTEKPCVIAGEGVYYFPEIFECKIWLNGRKTNDTPPDANGFSSRDDTPDAVYDPLGSARTSSFKNAMRMLGFGVDISKKDVLKNVDVPETKINESKTKDCPAGAELMELSEGEYIIVGRDKEVMDTEAIKTLVEASKEVIDSAKNAVEETKKDVSSKTSEEIVDTEEPEKEASSDKVIEKEETKKEVSSKEETSKEVVSKIEKRTRRTKAEMATDKILALNESSSEKEIKEVREYYDSLKKAHKEKVSDDVVKKLENAEKGDFEEIVSSSEEKTDIPHETIAENDFFSTDELRKVAEAKFEVLNDSSEALKKLNGKTFREVFEEDNAVFKAIFWTGSANKIKDKLSPETVENAKIVWEAMPK